MNTLNFYFYIAAIPALVLAATPAAVEALSLQCLIRTYLNVSCPGCGGTRALRALFSGGVAEAIQSNAAVTVVSVAIFPAAGWLALRHGFMTTRRHVESGKRPT